MANRMECIDLLGEDSSVECITKRESEQKLPSVAVAPVSLARRDSSDSDDSSLVGRGVQCSATRTECERKLPPEASESRAPWATAWSDESDSDDSLMLGGPVFASRAQVGSVASSNTSTANQSSKLRLSRRERDALRRQKKEEREAQKQVEKEKRQDQRQAQKLQREADKKAAAQLKKLRILQAQQSSGKFAAEEICLIMEGSLHQAMETVTLGLRETYSVHASKDVITNSVQWIRRDHMHGGASGALEAYQEGDRKRFEQLERLAIVFYDPKIFLSLLDRDEMDDDYPSLQSYLESLPKKKKVVLVLHQIYEEINRQWTAHRREKRGKAPPTDVELKDAIVWLLVQFQTECIPCSTDDEILATLSKMTRALSEAPYQQQVTELECVKKIKSSYEASAEPYAKARDCWIRQLQQIPKMGENQARNLAQYFPTARSLWEAYQDPSRTEAEKRLLVAPLLHEGRQQPKLSDSLFRLLTSTNPDELV